MHQFPDIYFIPLQEISPGGRKSAPSQTDQRYIRKTYEHDEPTLRGIQMLIPLDYPIIVIPPRVDDVCSNDLATAGCRTSSVRGYC
jgi:hypothetical protein